MILPNGKGKYKTVDVQKTGLPLYDFTKTDNPGISIDMWTKTHLEDIGYKLTELEADYHNIKGFVRTNNYGWSALYSLKEILMGRGIYINISESN